MVVGVGTMLIYALDLFKHDLTVPFNYWGDTLWFTTIAKAIDEGSGPYFIPSLSAPFGLPSASFPAITHFDWLVMSVLAIPFDGPGKIINLFWILSVMATSVSAFYSFLLIGLRRYWLVAMLAASYSILTYTLLRNTAHINLVYFAVPPLCVLVYYLACGMPDRRRRLIVCVGLSAILIQGFDYIYYNFYTCILLAYASAQGYCSYKDSRFLRLGAFFICLTIAATTLNLTPAFYSWYKHGAPSGLDYKASAEAEIYGLKIRHLLTPSPNSPVPGLSAWASKDVSAGFPLENENSGARLGLLGSIGFLILVMTWFSALAPIQHLVDNRQRALAGLVLICVLVATVGGFGAIFNLLVDDFRAYNRISVFIAFFSLAGLGIFTENLLRSRSQRTVLVAAVAVCAVAGLSFADQLSGARHIQQRATADRALFEEEAEIVAKAEALLPNGVAVLQMPALTFPLEEKAANMLTYDHARPFLHSKHLRWSWPSFLDDHRAWQAQIVKLTASEKIAALKDHGFRAIWVDRLGYEDGGLAYEAQLVEAGLTPNITSKSGRWAVYEIPHQRSTLSSGDLGNGTVSSSRSSSSEQSSILNTELFHGSSLIEFTGWSVPESQHRWSEMNEATITVDLHGDAVTATTIRIKGFTHGRQSTTISLNGREVFSGTLSGHYETIEIPIPAGTLTDGPNTILFQTPEARRGSETDSRMLGFAFVSLTFL